MRKLPDVKTSSRVTPYERYGSRVSRRSSTALASFREAGPFSGETIRSTMNAR